MEQIDETGAELPVTSCANCRQTFDDGQAHFKWDKEMHSLLLQVAALSGQDVAATSPGLRPALAQSAADPVKRTVVRKKPVTPAPADQ